MGLFGNSVPKTAGIDIVSLCVALSGVDLCSVYLLIYL